MKTLFRMAVLALLVAIPGLRAASPPTAQQVLDNAKAQARAHHKTILVLFGASW